VENDILFRIKKKGRGEDIQLVVPKGRREEVMREAHDEKTAGTWDISKR